MYDLIIIYFGDLFEQIEHLERNVKELLELQICISI